ncbi:IS256 family transposase [Mycoplasma sp. B6400]|uniref:IS256 family transposase n=2 Tax=unclassified Mycoplasma TaxID=2683645 RepID=UPI003AB0305F
MKELAQILGITTESMIEQFNDTMEKEANSFIREEKDLNPDSNVKRNGYRESTKYTLNGKITLKIPRVRGKNFIPSALAKYEKCSRDFETLIAILLASFLSYEQVSRIVELFTGIKVGHSLINRIKQKIDVLSSQMFKHDIQGEWLALFIDASYHNVMKWYNPITGEIAENIFDVDDKKNFIKKSYKVGVYTAIGINKDGYKELLSMKVQDAESKINWSKFLYELKERGMVDPEFIICDDFSGNDVLKEIFPTSQVQKCVIHKIRNALTHVNYKDRKSFVEAFKKIYTASNLEIAEKEFIYFKQTHYDKYPKAVEILEKSLDEILKFMKLPIKLRKFIYTNNISENFNSALKRYINEKRSHASVRTLQYFCNLASLWITKNWANKRIIL